MRFPRSFLLAVCQLSPKSAVSFPTSDGELRSHIIVAALLLPPQTRLSLSEIPCWVALYRTASSDLLSWRAMWRALWRPASLRRSFTSVLLQRMRFFFDRGICDSRIVASLEF